MAIRHLLTIAELGSQNLSNLVRRSLAIATGRAENQRPLAGKIVGVYFRGPSTRTRTSFTVGAKKLGAGTIAYGPSDLQIVTGETTQDTARVLSGFIDALVVRTNQSIQEMKDLSCQGEMAIINAMSENEHPTQAIADLSAILEEFGRLNDIHILYLGEGNNTAASFALAVAQTPGMRLTLVTPEGYGLPESILETVHGLAMKHGAFIEHHHEINRLPKAVDGVYTTRWQTMGAPKSESDWQKKFEPFTITPALMDRVSKISGTAFFHDLPSVRGWDVVDVVLDGSQSRAFRQARHKLFSAMAVLEWCVAGQKELAIGAG